MVLGLVPRISAFYGIAVYMYWDDDDHPLPHFHARYAGQWASIAIAGPRVLVGELPRRAREMVLEWARLHEAELLANWERARGDDRLVRVAPLP
jgi:hypothetical protein